MKKEYEYELNAPSKMDLDQVIHQFDLRVIQRVSDRCAIVAVEKLIEEEATLGFEENGVCYTSRGPVK